MVKKTKKIFANNWALNDKNIYHSNCLMIFFKA